MIISEYIIIGVDKIVKEILYSPQGRAFSTILSTFGSGILCSSVVTDITVNSKLDWSHIYSSKVAGSTLVFILFLLVYYIGMYNIDVTNDAVLKNYEDRDFLIAMMRKGQMKHLIKRAAKQIKKGNYDELHSIDKILKGEYGNDSGSNDGSREEKDSTFG